MQYRRERVKPVLDFLDVASAYVAGVDIAGVMDIPYDENVGSLQENMTKEEWRSAVAGEIAEPNVMDITRAATLASTAAPTKEMHDAIYVLTKSLPTTEEDDRQAFGEAIRSVHAVVERYVVD